VRRRGTRLDLCPVGGHDAHQVVVTDQLPLIQKGYQRLEPIGRWVLDGLAAPWRLLFGEKGSLQERLPGGFCGCRQ
jgi:hypothetical protein